MLGKKSIVNSFQEEAAFATLIANQDGYKHLLSPGAIPTVTQNRLLAALLERQRWRAIQSAWRHARIEKMRMDFWSTVTWLLHPRGARTLGGDSANPFRQPALRHT
jgi:hypothetical protein